MDATWTQYLLLRGLDGLLHYIRRDSALVLSTLHPQLKDSAFLCLRSDDMMVDDKVALRLCPPLRAYRSVTLCAHALDSHNERNLLKRKHSLGMTESL